MGSLSQTPLGTNVPGVSRQANQPSAAGSTGEEVTKLLPTGAVCVPGSNTYLLASMATMVSDVRVC